MQHKMALTQVTPTRLPLSMALHKFVKEKSRYQFRKAFFFVSELKQESIKSIKDFA